MKLVATTFWTFPNVNSWRQRKIFKELKHGYLFEVEALLTKTFSDNIKIDDDHTPFVLKSDKWNA